MDDKLVGAENTDNVESISKKKKKNKNKIEGKFRIHCPFVCTIKIFFP